jgi:hypothetical protein
VRCGEGKCSEHYESAVKRCGESEGNEKTAEHFSLQDEWKDEKDTM